MAYLDYSKLQPFLDRHFAKNRDERLVGRARDFDSGYFDIHRFFGASAVQPEHVAITVENDQFSFKDQRIIKFAAEVTSNMMAEGRLYEGPSVAKLAKDAWTSRHPSLTIQEATYGAQAGSCFALDLVNLLFSDYGGTLREYYPTLMRDHGVASNPLAICLGACGVLRVTEGSGQYLLRVLRGKKLASLEASYGPSVAGSIEWATDYKTLWDMTVRTMIAETAEELALRPTEYRIIPLAYAREIFRGEKPQVFCLIECLLSRDSLTERLASIPEARREFTSFDFHRIAADGTIDPAVIDSLNHEARLNYYLFEEYLVAGKGKTGSGQAPGLYIHRAKTSDIYFVDVSFRAGQLFLSAADDIRPFLFKLSLVLA